MLASVCACSNCRAVTLLADVAYEALALQLGQARDRFGDRTLVGVHCRAQPHVDHVQCLQAEALQVFMHLPPQACRRHIDIPRSIGATAETDLGHDDQIAAIGMQCFADECVGHIGAVELRGVDVVGAQGDCFAQHRQGRCLVGRRSPDMRSG